ncbi:unnamed protein product, partial [Discosporangium mesarthrocarpum]
MMGGVSRASVALVAAVLEMSSDVNGGIASLTAGCNGGAFQCHVASGPSMGLSFVVQPPSRLSWRARRMSRQRYSSSYTTSGRTVDAPSGTFSSGVVETPSITRSATAVSPSPPKGVTVVLPGDPIEYWHAKSLGLGFYQGPTPGRKSLTVQSASGEQILIDVGQIVSVWRRECMRGPLPESKEDWSKLRSDVRGLLQSMPARGLDLEGFWKAAIARGKGFVVTSAHAAEYLFAGNPKRRGLRKRGAFDFDGSDFKPSAVERAAAAHLLSMEVNRLKRVVSTQEK